MGDFNPEDHGYEVVGYINWYSGDHGYEWSGTRVYVNRQREFFMYSDSGCSCNYFGSELHSARDLEPLYGKLNAIKVMRAKAVGRHIQVIEDIDELCAEILRLG